MDGYENLMEPLRDFCAQNKFPMEIVEPAAWFVIHDCPKWLIPFTYDRHTKIWLRPESASLEIEARSLVDRHQVEDLSAILPVAEWDADLLEGYGLTEPLFDLERMYLSQEWRLKSHEFLIDLRETPVTPFLLRIVWSLELQDANELLSTLQTIHLPRREYHGSKKWPDLSQQVPLPSGTAMSQVPLSPSLPPGTAR